MSVRSKPSLARRRGAALLALTTAAAGGLALLARARLHKADGGTGGGAAPAAQFRRLASVRRLPSRRAGRLVSVASPPRHGAGRREQRPRRLRRRHLPLLRARDALFAARIDVPGHDREPAGHARDVQGRLHAGVRAVAAVPGGVRRRAHPGAAVRLGRAPARSRAVSAGSTCIPTPTSRPRTRCSGCARARTGITCAATATPPASASASRTRPAASTAGGASWGTAARAATAPARRTSRPRSSPAAPARPRRVS